MSSERVNVTIDGRVCEAEKGDLLIKVAQDHGVYIPRFCWHERMKPVGMCRMCLVGIEGTRGLPPACTTPVTDGMVVDTVSDGVKKAQDGVLEFLLINHPLDCPVCDRGGECPLQDQTLAFGPGESRFIEEKRHFAKPIPISDLVMLDRERCIQCARCTRFADELAGDPLITFVDRGDRTEVLNFPDEPFASYFSGNTVQICPVGALTSKPYRFKARPWDLDTVESSCMSCAVGCRVALQSTSNRLVRMLGVDSEPVNQGWLCDKGRYGFEYVHSPNRVRNPMVRKGNDMVEASWPEALDIAAEGLRKVLAQHGPQAIAVLGGARGTNEDAYAWARFAKSVLRTDNVDAQIGDGLPPEVILGLPRAEIADLDRAAAVVLLASDLKEELPVLYLRARRAAADLGIPLIDLGPRDNGLTRYASAVLRAMPGEVDGVARKLAGVLAGQSTGDADVDRVSELLEGRAGDVVVVLGRQSLAESPHAVVRAAAALSTSSRVRFLSALRRGNVHGALDLGLTPGFLPGRVALDAGREWFTEEWGGVPEQRGLDATGILQAATEGRIKALVVLGADPMADFPDRELAERALDRIELMIAVGAFATETSKRAAVILPTALYGEKAGTATNVEGRVQRIGQKISPDGTPMADWRIASELALRFGVDFDVESVGELQDEIARVAPAFHGVGAHLIRRARDGVVLPLAEHAAEIQVGGAEFRSEFSWDPIPSGSDAAQGDTVDVAVDEEHRVSEDAEVARDLEAEEADAPAIARPELYRWDARTAPEAHVPPRDSYALRLVAGRTLYDQGRSVTESPSVANLVKRAVLLVNRVDRDRIGVHDGEEVKVSTGRGSLRIPVCAEVGTPVGTAFLAVRQSSPSPADLVDVALPVTDIRVETIR